MSEEKPAPDLPPANSEPKEQQPEEADQVILDKLDRAEAITRRMEEGNKELDKLLKKQERLQVEQKLGGETMAGNSKGPTKEQQEIKAARDLIKGSGFEDELFPES